MGRNEDGQALLPEREASVMSGVETGVRAEAVPRSMMGGQGAPPPEVALRLSLKVEWGVGSPGQGASLIAQLVKNLPALWDSRLRKTPWSRDRLPTPVFWPGKSHGLERSWGRKESDTTFTFTFSPGEWGGVGWPIRGKGQREEHPSPARVGTEA